MIARATGHQRSPRSAGGASPIAGRSAGFGSVAILHDGPGPPGVNPAARGSAVAADGGKTLVTVMMHGLRPGGQRAGVHLRVAAGFIRVG
jgi:hypothetical protein